MHLWRATFRVGDFGTKQLTLTTLHRAYLGDDNAGATGGFAEAEWRALEMAQSETNGWPTPIELVSIEWIDELSDPQPAMAPSGHPGKLFRVK